MGIFSLFSQSLINEDYVFFDVETTGLYPLNGDRIIEIAMIKTSKGKIVDTINTFVNPGIDIPEEVTNINNITNDMVKDSHYFNKDFSEKILNFIDQSILVAHNAAFDIGFLSVELGRLGIIFERWKAIDTLKIANKVFPGQRNRLENLMRRYNILPEGDLHRALIDTDALRKVFFEFLEESDIRSLSIEQIIKKFGFLGQNIHRAMPGLIRESLIEQKEIKGKYRKRDHTIIDLHIIPISPVWVDNKWFLLAREFPSQKIISIFCENFIDINH